jgi:hypothetical protein
VSLLVRFEFEAVSTGLRATPRIADVPKSVIRLPGKLDKVD